MSNEEQYLHLLELTGRAQATQEERQLAIDCFNDCSGSNVVDLLRLVNDEGFTNVEAKLISLLHDIFTKKFKKKTTNSQRLDRILSLLKENLSETKEIKLKSENCMSTIEIESKKMKDLHDRIHRMMTGIDDKMEFLTKFLSKNKSCKKSTTNKIQIRTKPIARRPRLQPDRLSSIFSLKDSFLRNLAAFRLTSKFRETGIALTDLSYTHTINPNDFVCLPDLIGSCIDKTCPYQHKSNYLMNDIEKLADILSYKPSLTGFKPDPNLPKETNDNNCRLKLKLYAARLLSKNPGKPVEIIAENLVKYMRSNRADAELLVTTRVLPKAVHLVSSSDKKDTNSPEISESKQ